MKKAEELENAIALKNLARNILGVSTVLLLLQIITALTGPYHGNVIQKLVRFYSDKQIYLKARALPLFVSVNLFGYIYTIIKIKKLSKKVIR